MTKVSVIIPTYNRNTFIQEALNSVRAQSFMDYEVIVVDDGSTDSTGEMLQNTYDEKVHYMWQENQGESVARNKGIELANGEYIAFLDSDDKWLSKKLEMQVRLLDEYPEIGMSFCQAQLINETGNLLDSSVLGRNLHENEITFENLVMHNLIGSVSSSMIRKVTLERIGGFDPLIRYGEDWDLWLRIHSLSKFGFISEPLVQLRRHQSTQCYFPSTEGNSKRLADHLVILDKAFANWQGSLSKGIQEKAYAYQYAQSFLAEKSVNNDKIAKNNLQKACGLFPDILREAGDFGQLIVDNGSILVKVNQSWDYDAAIEYVARVFDDLTLVGVNEKHFESVVWAKLYAMLGFLAEKNGEDILARNYLISAMRYDFGWLKNRGVLSIVSKSLFGINSVNQKRSRNRFDN